MRLPRTDDPGGHRPMIDAHFQNEMVEALLVDARQGFLKLQGKFHESGEMTPSGTVLRHNRLGDSRGGHVGRSYRLDFDDGILEFILIQDLFGKNIQVRMNRRECRMEIVRGDNLCKR